MEEKGFTIIEMLVVVSITIILSSILIGYSRKSEQQIVFFKEQSLLTGSLFQTKAFAIETFQPTFQPSPGTPVTAPSSERICGWGVSVENRPAGQPDRYIIFRDIAVGGPDCDKDADKKYTPLQNEEFDEIILDPLVEFSCLDIVPSGGNCTAPGKTTIDLLFIPPDPKTAFDPAGSPQADDAIIVLELADKSRKTTIRINEAGQISVQ